MLCEIELIFVSFIEFQSIQRLEFIISLIVKSHSLRERERKKTSKLLTHFLSTLFLVCSSFNK
jgi:hypothetical protein